MFSSFTQISGMLAGVISLLAFFFYYISIIRGTTRPNRTTWFVLTVVGILIASSYFSLGARSTIWVSLSYILGPLIAFLLSFKFGENEDWSNFDKYCLIGAIVGLFFWLVFDMPFLTLLSNIIVDMFGILPTVKKSFLDPFSEALFPWTLTFIASLLNLLAVETFSTQILVYPVYMLLFNGIIFISLLRGRFKKII